MIENDIIMSLIKTAQEQGGTLFVSSFLSALPYAEAVDESSFRELLLRLYEEGISIEPTDRERNASVRPQEARMGEEYIHMLKSLEGDKEEELLLISSLSPENDHAKTRLAELSMPYACDLVRLWMPSSDGYLQDLVNEAGVGLMHAVDIFCREPKERRSYETWNDMRSWWIHAFIMKAFYDHMSQQHIADHLVSGMNAVNASLDRLFQEKGTAPSAFDISEDTGIPLNKVYTILNEIRGRASDNKLAGGRETGSSGQESDGYGYEQRHKEMEMAISGAAITSELEKLDVMQRYVIQLLYGTDGSRPMTVDEAAEKIGISEDEVRSLEKEALQILRSSGGRL